ncbi:hypothetical protein BU23DRAFT_566170 [Bimuria novae-zelandiae CBS 107.79]|uniref:F-box domain-containing protein n=1 Tax=Bimuria novae-zelandiae CBS 107.79 TaxID=1447943 RepID=A0A6A5VRT1_9PLEO|nr:hypothetical protein BU23DRAFT_566170 [Bimuria novae-zelandiae CBS 107.79]
MVFKKLSQEGKPPDLVNASLACKLWSKICIPVLWAHIYATNENLISFVEPHDSYGDTKGPLLRSLTVHARPIPQRNPFGLPGPSSLSMRLGQTSRGRIIKELRKRYEVPDLDCANAKSLENLILLLISSGCNPDHPLDQWADGAIIKLMGLPAQILEALMLALPQMCRSLEIDDIISTSLPATNSGGGHICSSLRTVIPRLNYLCIDSVCTCPCRWNPETYDFEDGVLDDPEGSKKLFSNMKGLWIGMGYWTYYLETTRKF